MAALLSILSFYASICSTSLFNHLLLAALKCQSLAPGSSSQSITCSWQPFTTVNHLLFTVNRLLLSKLFTANHLLLAALYTVNHLLLAAFCSISQQESRLITTPLCMTFFSLSWGGWVVVRLLVTTTAAVLVHTEFGRTRRASDWCGAGAPTTFRRQLRSE